MRALAAPIGNAGNGGGTARPVDHTDAQAQGVTEELKASDQMRWVGMMNSIRHSAEETVLRELVYA